MAHHDNRHKQISERAHKMWEEQGRPHGKHEEHWSAAEKVVDQIHNEGEGSRSAAHRYNEGTREFIASGQVASKSAEAARAIDGPEGAELKRAERVGRAPAAKRPSSTGTAAKRH